jgi:Skp family chaperone for outer membrane proteins
MAMSPVVAIAQANTGVSIVTVDRQSFFFDSAAGKEIAKQVKGLKEEIEGDLTKKAEAFEIEREQLAGQQSILTQEVFEQKAKQLQEKYVALQQEAATKERQLRAGMAKAQNEVWQAVSPILDAILKEKSATLILERSVIVKGAVDIDVTATAMQRLNDKLPTVKVALAPLKAQN